jgi:hypothetical protein
MVRLGPGGGTPPLYGRRDAYHYFGGASAFAKAMADRMANRTAGEDRATRDVETCEGKRTVIMKTEYKVPSSGFRVPSCRKNGALTPSLSHPMGEGVDGLGCRVALGSARVRARELKVGQGGLKGGQGNLR